MYQLKRTFLGIFFLKIFIVCYTVLNNFMCKCLKVFNRVYALLSAIIGVSIGLKVSRLYVQFGFKQWSRNTL